jgi:alanine racemase
MAAGQTAAPGWQTWRMDGHPEALVDLDAIQANVAAIRSHVGSAQVMAVVKSDGYGHGMLASARAALAGGATWLGVVQLADAIDLRRAGLTAPVLSLHGSPDAPHAEAIRRDVDMTAGTAALVDQIARAAEGAGKPARLHLEADTGMSRGGASSADWPGLVRAALVAEAAGRVRVVGLWSHFACADIPGHPSIGRQLGAFREAVELAERAGVRPEVRHVANGPATLTLPESYLDLVRPGGAVYGLCTLPGGVPGWLRPAMTVRARLVQVKHVAAGVPVSYGHRYAAQAATTLGLLPLGYNEGIPRLASSAPGLMFTRGRRVQIAGTVNLNHVILDLGVGPAEAGDEVVLFGPGDHGEPTAQDWAEALGTISYEIVTRFTGKVPRSYCGVTATTEVAAHSSDGSAHGQVAATL